MCKHVQFFMSMLMKIVFVYILTFTFFDDCFVFRSLLHFCMVSSTTLCIVEKTLFIVPFFRGKLGTWPATCTQEASLKAVQYLLTFGL